MTLSKEELRREIRLGLSVGKDVSNFQIDLSKYYLLDTHLQFSPYATSKLREYLEDYFDYHIVAAENFVIQAITDHESEYQRLLSEKLQGQSSEIWMSRNQTIKKILADKKEIDVNTRAEFYIPFDENAFQKEKLQVYIDDWLLGVDFISPYLLKGALNHTDNFIKIILLSTRGELKKLIELCLAHGIIKEIFGNKDVLKKYLNGNDIVYLKDKKAVETLYDYLPVDCYLEVAKYLYTAAWSVTEFVSLAGNLDFLRELYAKKRPQPKSKAIEQAESVKPATQLPLEEKKEEPVKPANQLPVEMKKEEPIKRTEEEIELCFYSFSLLQGITGLLPLFVEKPTVCSALLSQEIELLIANTGSLRGIIVERESFYRMLLSNDILKKNENYNYWSRRLNVLFRVCELQHFGPELTGALSYIPPTVRDVVDYPAVRGVMARYLPKFSSVMQYIPSSNVFAKVADLPGVKAVTGYVGHLINRRPEDVELKVIESSSGDALRATDDSPSAPVMNKSILGGE